MAETPPIVQTPVAAPQAVAPVQPVQTPAQTVTVPPAAPLPPQPATPAPIAQPPVAAPPVAAPIQPPVSPLQNIVAQPIAPAVAAQLTVDMESLTNAVDEAYGRVR